LTWVDYGILGIITVSMAIGLWRGLLKETISLVTWIAALLVALFFGDDAAVYLADRIARPAVRLTVAAGVLFLTTLFLGELLNIAITLLRPPARLRLGNRALGGLCGALRGVTLVTLIVLLAALTPLPQQPPWRQSGLTPLFQPAATVLRDLLPPVYAAQFAFP